MHGCPRPLECSARPSLNAVSVHADSIMITGRLCWPSPATRTPDNATFTVLAMRPRPVAPGDPAHSNTMSAIHMPPFVANKCTHAWPQLTLDCLASTTACVSTVHLCVTAPFMTDASLTRVRFCRPLHKPDLSPVWLGSRLACKTEARRGRPVGARQLTHMVLAPERAFSVCSSKLQAFTARKQIRYSMQA